MAACLLLVILFVQHVCVWTAVPSTVRRIHDDDDSNFVDYDVKKLSCVQRVGWAQRCSEHITNHQYIPLSFVRMTGISSMTTYCRTPRHIHRQ
jgi:hypothetical protein